MAITYEHVETGRRHTLPEPTDEPVRREKQRAQAIRKMDASPLWRRADETEEAAGAQEAEPGHSAGYDSMSLKELREVAKERGLSAGGSKADIRERLAASEE